MRTRLVRSALIALIALAGALQLGACGEDEIAGSAPTGSSDLDGSWVLEADGFDAPLTKETTPTLDIAGTMWSGFGGCNRYNTTATITGEDIELSPVASTMMACPDPAMEVETLYFQRLNEVTSFSQDGSDLELKDSSGKVVLTYAKS